MQHPASLFFGSQSETKEKKIKEKEKETRG